MPLKRILCLANSRKLSGRCIAGKEIFSGLPAGWIRPVSDRPSQEVSEVERQYQDGSDPKVLDFINIQMTEPSPDAWHTENWRFDIDYYWMKTGTASLDLLPGFLDSVQRLWPNDFSGKEGRSDRIFYSEAALLRDSLRFILVPEVVLHVVAPNLKMNQPKRKVRAIFTHAGLTYSLGVTDPIMERRFLAQPDGKYPLGESFLTISLGEKHSDGFCYKLVAAVIERDQSGNP